MGDRGLVELAVFKDYLRRYLEAGFVVISIDYRLAPETKLPQIIEDLQDAFRWVRKTGPEAFQIDPQRVAVTGGSAGGYLTLMAGCCVQPPPQCLVSFYGYGDIVGEWYAKPNEFYLREPAVPKEVAYASVGQIPLSGCAFLTKESDDAVDSTSTVGRTVCGAMKWQGLIRSRTWRRWCPSAQFAT